MSLNTLQYTGQYPTTKNCLAPDVNRTEVEAVCADTLLPVDQQHLGQLIAPSKTFFAWISAQHPPHCPVSVAAAFPSRGWLPHIPDSKCWGPLGSVLFSVSCLSFLFGLVKIESWLKILPTHTGIPKLSSSAGRSTRRFHLDV